MKNRIFRRLMAVTLCICLAASLFGCGASGDDQDFDDLQGYEEEEEDYPEEDEYDEYDDAGEAIEADYQEEPSEDDGFYVDDMGITFYLPEEYFSTSGVVDFYGQDVTGGEGYFYGEMAYTGIDWNETEQKIQNDGFTEADAEEYAEKTVPLFIIMGAGKDKTPSNVVENINAYIDKKYKESGMNLIKETDDFCFYLYDDGSYENLDNLDGVYRTEYDTLAALNDDVVQKAKYSRPLTSFERMMGDTVSFTTTDLDGNTVTSEEIFSQHEITMVNVWATWCGWCVDELGELEKINNELQSIDCGIIGLCGDANSDDAISEAKSLLKENGVTYLNICPFDGWNEIFELTSWPTSFFVDRNGKIVTTPVVGANLKEYVPHIQEALEGKESSVLSAKNSYESSSDNYRILVYDENSAPVEGAMVQFCTSNTCKMAVTDSTGAAVFDDPPGEYDVHLLKVPEGYEDNSTGYKTEPNYSDMVITLKKK